jgi:fructokinase
MIVSLGEALLDLFALPIGSSFEEASSFKPCPGGAPANVAVVLARLGVPVRFVGSIGSGALGDRVLHELRSAGVDCGAIYRSAKPAGAVFIESLTDGKRRFLGYSDAAAEYDLPVAHLRACRPHPLDEASWLVTGSGSQTHEPMASALVALVDEARGRQVPMLVDLNVRAHRWSTREEMRERVSWLASEAAVVKASDEDLEALGLPPSLEALATLNRSAVLVLSRGRDGATAQVAGELISSPAVTVSVVDATGAGDAFTAGLVGALARFDLHPVTSADRFRDPRRWPDVLRLANRLGALATTEVGCTEAFRRASPTLLEASS